MTRGELVAELAATLGARHEARIIVEEVLGRRPAPPDRMAVGAAIAAARALAARRADGEPLQYVLGHWAFRTLDLLVDPRVLIPRPETEQVVEVALGELRRLAPSAPVIVDAGTGSGAIALSLAVELAGPHPAGHLWATEASPDALAVATANLERVRGQCDAALLPVSLVGGSWLSPLPPDLKGTVHLVVANPPYVATSEWHELPADVRCEPRQALVSAEGADGTPGLADTEEVLSEAWVWLTRPGVAVIEMAPHQTGAATAAARSMGFADVRVEPDLTGRPRALVARTL